MTTGHSKRPDLKEMGGLARKFFTDLKKMCCDILKEYQEKRQKNAVFYKPTHAREEKHTKAPKTTAATVAKPKTSVTAKPKTAGAHKKTMTKKKGEHSPQS